MYSNDGTITNAAATKSYRFNAKLSSMVDTDDLVFVVLSIYLIQMIQIQAHTMHMKVRWV